MTNFREYLERRETELAQQLSDLYRQLGPLEAELAEIRRAKASIGMTNPLMPGGIGLAGLGGLGATGIGNFNPSASENPLLPSPYANLTMKQLVVKALSEHFYHGATTRQLLEFFRDAWGRDVNRLSLSPQLTRLVQDGVIAKSGDNDWVLIAENIGD